eukprot:2327656-Amphidinium_carterae.2
MAYSSASAEERRFVFCRLCPADVEQRCSPARCDCTTCALPCRIANCPVTVCKGLNVNLYLVLLIVSRLWCKGQLVVNCPLDVAEQLLVLSVRLL